jgi:hypothetical protein
MKICFIKQKNCCTFVQLINNINPFKMTVFLKNILLFLTGETPFGTVFAERERERERDLR